MSGAASAGARDIPLGVRRRARRLAWVYLIVAVGLIVWTVFLALSLPRENLERHFRLTWTGFDLILVLAMYLTAHMAFRLDARVVFPATVVATLLVVDAWFDVTTSTTAEGATEALILALLVNCRPPRSPSTWPTGWASAYANWPISDTGRSSSGSR